MRRHLFFRLVAGFLSVALVLEPAVPVQAFVVEDISRPRRSVAPDPYAFQALAARLACFWRDRNETACQLTDYLHELSTNTSGPLFRPPPRTTTLKKDVHLSALSLISYHVAKQLAKGSSGETPLRLVIVGGVSMDLGPLREAALRGFALAAGELGIRGEVVRMVVTEEAEARAAVSVTGAVGGLRLGYGKHLCETGLQFMNAEGADLEASLISALLEELLDMEAEPIRQRLTLLGNIRSEDHLQTLELTSGEKAAIEAAGSTNGGAARRCTLMQRVKVDKLRTAFDAACRAALKRAENGQSPDIQGLPWPYTAFGGETDYRAGHTVLRFFRLNAPGDRIFLTAVNGRVEVEVNARDTESAGRLVQLTEALADGLAKKADPEETKEGPPDEGTPASGSDSLASGTPPILPRSPDASPTLNYVHRPLRRTLAWLSRLSGWALLLGIGPAWSLGSDAPPAAAVDITLCVIAAAMIVLPLLVKPGVGITGSDGDAKDAGPSAQGPRVYTDGEGRRRVAMDSLPAGPIRDFLVQVLSQSRRGELQLMGGAVRDLFLGRVPRDFDLFFDATAFLDPALSPSRHGSEHSTAIVETPSIALDADGRFQGIPAVPHAKEFFGLTGFDLTVSHMVLGFDESSEDPLLIDPEGGYEDLLHHRARLMGTGPDINVRRAVEHMIRATLAPDDETDRLLSRLSEQALRIPEVAGDEPLTATDRVAYGAGRVYLLWKDALTNPANAEIVQLLWIALQAWAIAREDEGHPGLLDYLGVADPTALERKLASIPRPGGNSSVWIEPDALRRAVSIDDIRDYLGRDSNLLLPRFSEGLTGEALGLHERAEIWYLRTQFGIPHPIYTELNEAASLESHAFAGHYEMECLRHRLEEQSVHVPGGALMLASPVGLMLFPNGSDTVAASNITDLFMAWKQGYEIALPTAEEVLFAMNFYWEDAGDFIRRMQAGPDRRKECERTFRAVLARLQIREPRLRQYLAGRDMTFKDYTALASSIVDGDEDATETILGSPPPATDLTGVLVSVLAVVWLAWHFIPGAHGLASPLLITAIVAALAAPPYDSPRESVPFRRNRTLSLTAA